MLENCLQAFESFVLRCPKEIGPHVDGIVTLALKFIKYDPNYADEDDDDDEDMEQVDLGPIVSLRQNTEYSAESFT